ncbi:MAG: type II toxin-antitoxin system VapC family toxin [Blastocatellia bacterium]
MAILIDSNLIIYASQPDGMALRTYIREQNPFVSVISQIEVLGYHKLMADEKELLEAFFANTTPLAITAPVVNEAIHLRQMRKMSLGDALIAATALVNQLTLATHNTKDFAWIQGLSVTDPMAITPDDLTDSHPVSDSVN